MTDLVLRNNENRPSLTSGAAPVAGRQQAISKNTISAHGPPHHAWAPGPPPSKSGDASMQICGNTSLWLRFGSHFLVSSEH